MPDTLTLRLEMRVPEELGGRTVVVEQRLNRRDVARMLAVFDTFARRDAPEGWVFSSVVAGWAPPDSSGTAVATRTGAVTWPGTDSGPGADAC